MAASCGNTDIWGWINNLPRLSQWKKDTMSICICSSNSTSANLSLSIARNIPTQTLTFSILATFNLPISLWTSKPVYASSNSLKLLGEETTYSLIFNFIQDILKYGPVKPTYPVKVPRISDPYSLKEVFNVSFLTLAFLVCIYEAPIDLRSSCLVPLKDELTTAQSLGASKLLLRLLGSYAEELWMRCINLAVTNLKMEVNSANHILKGRCPLFSYASYTAGFWKVQLYCPIITMEVENMSGSADDHLAFSLNYHQLEGVIQLNPTVTVREKWIDVMVNVDNLRLDVVRLVNETLLNDRGAGVAEKHFPSRISLQLTPISQTDILSVTVNKSSDNPEKGIEKETGLEFSFEPPKAIGIQVSTGETTTTTFRPWKFEETVYGNSGGLNWFLHDSSGGREVFSTKPSPMSLLHPKAWFKHRYSHVQRPFTRQGGVVFAKDEYGQTVCWKVDKSALGRRLEWELSGCIGLTYWPNKYRTFYNETRRAEFAETLQLTLG